MEILKQGQYSPLSVEKQIAIIYCGTKGLLRDVPVKEIKNFEKDFLNILDAQHRSTLDALKKGDFNDTITGTLEKVAKELVAKYSA